MQLRNFWYNTSLLIKLQSEYRFLITIHNWRGGRSGRFSRGMEYGTKDWSQIGVVCGWPRQFPCWPRSSHNLYEIS